MSGASVTVLDSSRIDRLLRSLVGVGDVRLSLDAKGRVRTVTILRHGSMQEHQLVRNVLSGLKAGFGLRLDPGQVVVAMELSQWQALASVEAGEPAPVLQLQPLAVRNANDNGRGPAHQHGNGTGEVHGPGSGQGNGHGNGNGKAHGHRNGNGHANGAARVVANGGGAAGGKPAPRPATDDVAPARPEPRPSSAPEPRRELVDLERHGPMLRCRVVVRLGERTFSAIAEARAGARGEAELAALVALDALRAGGLTTGRLDGVALTTIGDVVYVVVGVRAAAGSVPRASAAPLTTTLAEAAADAALRAHGPVDVGLAAAGTL